MSFDLSWLWNLLNSITSTLNTWFASIWTQAQNITNTGQGLFSGLVAFGSQIWDALTKAFSTLGEWIGEAYDYLREGLENFASIFGQWLNSAMTFIGQGFSWIGSQFYNIGNWLYNALYTVWNWVVNTVIGAWNNLVAWFSGVCTAIGSWWGSVTTGINTWFSNIITGFRNKVVQTIQTDLTISMAWKGAERILMPQKASDIGYGIFGILASPIIGRLTGLIIDAVIPIASSTPYPLVPSITGFSYTPPSMTVETPTEKTPPSPTVSGAPTGYFTGISDVNLKGSIESYEVNVTAGQDLSRKITDLSYEVEVA